MALQGIKFAVNIQPTEGVISIVGEPQAAGSVSADIMALVGAPGGGGANQEATAEARLVAANVLGIQKG